MRKTRFYTTCVCVSMECYTTHKYVMWCRRSLGHGSRDRAHFLLGKLFSNVLYLMICSPTKTLDKVIWPIRYGANWNIIRYTWTKSVHNTIVQGVLRFTETLFWYTNRTYLNGEIPIISFWFPFSSWRMGCIWFFLAGLVGFSRQ